MKTLGKFLLGAIALLLIIALIPALLPDAEYSPGAGKWLEIAHAPATVPPAENRFHAQVGFLAAADTDMVEYGAGLVSSANRVLQANGTDFDPAWQEPPLRLSPGLEEFDFDAVIEDPLAWLAANRATLQRLVDENALLLERYGRLTQMTGYEMTLTPDYRAPIPDYSSLSKIHRLDSLAIAATIVADADNLPRLREAIDKQRFALADAATLIEKMVDIAMLHFDFRLYAELLKLPGVAERHEPFPALDAEERTLEKAYITEFAIASSSLDGDLSGEDSGWFEKLMIGMYLKPRKLENHAYEYTWQHLLALESRPLGERGFPEAGATYNWWQRYTNPIGYILYQVSRPGFTYHDRIEHLDGLITLVDCAAEIHRRSLRGKAITAYLSGVDAGAHPGYAGAVLGFDAGNNELYIELPGYDAAASTHPMDRLPRLALD